MLGNKTEARKLLSKSIELGGDAVKQKALDDEDLEGVWGGEEEGYSSSSISSSSIMRTPCTEHSGNPSSPSLIT